ncbi:MAG TPA: glycosyltransferase family 2 protein [Phenylobacterium sp.]|uniref:glycosyltransferase family 2 protein n=1 Tax=Phenylobacterium sp. TaxID=1871053 RepID=UPI002F95F92B
MHVAIVIVGFKNPDDIVECLRALEEATHSNFEVIICENGGAEAFRVLRDCLPQCLRGGQQVRVVAAPSNVGFAGGVNIGIANVPSADAWWLLNPDTAPEPGALAAKVARLKLGDCDAVGCTIYKPDGKVQSHGGRWRAWLARAESIGIGETLGSAVNPARIERKQSYLNGAAMLVGRRFLSVAGTMREEYFLYCEEVEWCLRAAKKGLRLGYAPEARVLHAQGTTTGAAKDVRSRPRVPVYLSARNAVLITRDHYVLRLPVATLALAGQLLLRYGRRGAWRQLGYGISGLIAGVRNERGVPRWLT